MYETIELQTTVYIANMTPIAIFQATISRKEKIIKHKFTLPNKGLNKALLI